MARHVRRAGANDEVLVSGIVTTGAVIEDGTASASGSVSFTDVDLTDDHVVTYAPVSSDSVSFTDVDLTDDLPKRSARCRGR